MSLLPNQSFVAPDKSLFARSGGGGGGGISTFNTINFSGGLNFDDPATPVIQDIIFSSYDWVPGSVSTNSIQINSPAGTAASLLLAAGNDTQGYIQANNSGDQTQPVPLQILSPTYLSSLNVSSINGAAPGGGVAPGANLTGLSTISVSSMTVTNGLLVTNGIAMSNTTLVYDTQGQAIEYFNAGNSNLYITGVSTASVNIGTQSNASAISVGDTGLAVTNITGVSSINGVQPTVKAAYPVSTLTGSQTYVPANNVAWPLSGDIPVGVGHTYRISGACAVANGGSGSTSFLISGGGAGFPSAFAAYENLAAIPGNGGYAAGIQTIFKPSATPVQVVAYNTDPTISTGLDFYWTNWLVEDLGTGLL